MPDFPPKAPLDPRYRALLGLMRFLRRLHVTPPASKVGGMPMVKRLAMKPAAWSLLPSSGTPHVQDRTVPGRHGEVPVRVYLPDGGATSPVAVLFVHGGGFTVGGLDSLDWFCRELSVLGGHAVVSVQYRLAPEFPYPVPLDDVTDALDWLAEHRGEFGAAQVAIAGDSAGGNLAAAAAVRATRAGLRLQSQILIYPALDATESSPSMRDQPGGLTRADIAASYENYCGAHDRRDPDISPLLAADKTGLPPALVIGADHDLLRDDARLYAEALTAAGVPARGIEYPGADHGFLSFPSLAASAARSTIDETLRILRTGDA
jgi:acetyl esterase